MRVFTHALALTAVVAAVPVPDAAGTTTVQPPRNQEFTVAFSVGVGSQLTYMAAHAVKNQTTPRSPGYGVVLVAKPLKTHRGTRAYMNGTSPQAALMFDIADPGTRTHKLYGATVPDFGSAYGNAGNVVGVLNYQDFNWSANNGSIFHKLYSGFDGFFACNDTVNGQPATVLKFGVYQRDSQAPVGCGYTNVIQRFNVQGGAKPPKM